MDDLFCGSGAEAIELEDAELKFWRRIDLGMDADALMERLLEDSAWRQDRITVYGKPYLQPRLSAWYGDVAYRYSGITLAPTAWTPLLQDIRSRVEDITGERFNSVLLNYYRDHNDSMGMHSDDEPSLGPQPAIASLSLGEERPLVLKHRTRRDLPSVKLPLPNGSLLLMRGGTQRCWRHGIARQRRACGARINLTFRLVKADSTRRK